MATAVDVINDTSDQSLLGAMLMRALDAQSVHSFNLTEGTYKHVFSYHVPPTHSVLRNTNNAHLRRSIFDIQIQWAGK